jgi:antirestriction protein ArdC
MAIGSDIYDEITAKVIVQLEAGTLPWVQPWQSRTGSAFNGMPANAATGRGYSGVNVLLLWIAQFDAGYNASQWVTFKQALDMGGHVRKGERATTAVFANTFIPKGEGERSAQTGETPRAVPFLKRFAVFNVEQCEGLPGFEPAPAPDLSSIEPRAAALIDATCADITIGGDKACYIPSRDAILLPPPSAYFESINWHRTAFHELAHWTGHKNRLDRDLSNGFGSAGYAREELVAEMGGAFVCASLGITPTVRHADYIVSWLKVLKEDSRAVVRAASAASKAADFILQFDKARAASPELMAA